MRNKKLFLILFTVSFLFISSVPAAQRSPAKFSDEQKLLQVMHSISSQTLYDYVRELTSDKYAGRLTGTEGFACHKKSKIYS